MKHLKIASVLSSFLILMAAVAFLATAQSSRAAESQSPVLSQLQPIRRENLPPAINSVAAITCTVATTTTDLLNGVNITFTTAAPLAGYNGLALAPANVPTSSVPMPVYDHYFILSNASPGVIYSVSAIPDGLGNYNLGMIIYNASFAPIYTDTNTLDNNNASLSVIFSATALTGPYYYRVFQLTPSCSGGTYHLTASGPTPTPTPSLTPTPSRTPSPTPTTTPTPSITPTPAPFACQAGADKFESNNSFDTATTIGLNVPYTGLNFAQCIPSDNQNDWDNDYFKVRVKAGMVVTCKTSSLSPGTDTNLILYTDSRNGIDGSDDVNRAAGDLSSSVTYYTTYEGWLYGLVGEGFHRPGAEAQNATYTYECDIVIQTTPTTAPTPTDAPGQPTRTPVPPTPTLTLIPSVTPTPTPPSIIVKSLPTPTQPGLPLIKIPISLQVYYDANQNNKPDPGEGITGVSARVYSLFDGQLLAQALTDETGRLSFTVNAPGAVNLVVPYLDFSRSILPSGATVVIRVSPSDLPQSIP